MPRRSNNEMRTISFDLIMLPFQLGIGLINQYDRGYAASASVILPTISHESNHLWRVQGGKRRDKSLKSTTAPFERRSMDRRYQLLMSLSLCCRPEKTGYLSRAQLH